MVTEEVCPVFSQNEMADQAEDDEHLHTLLIEFLRDTNLPFGTVDNPRFQDIITYLNPHIKPPTSSSIMQMASLEYEEATTSQSPTVSYDECDQKPPLNLKEYPSQAELSDIENGKSLPVGIYVCIICLKQQDMSRVRKLGDRDAIIFMFVCVAQGVYSLEIAQKLFSKPSKRCCTNHYSSVVEGAMDCLQISDPFHVVSSSEQAVAAAFYIVKNIKNPDVNENELEGPGAEKKVLGSFRHSLRCFFKRYAPGIEYQKAHFPEKSNEPKPPPPKIQKVDQYPLRGAPRPGEETFPEDFLEED